MRALIANFKYKSLATSDFVSFLKKFLVNEDSTKFSANFFNSLNLKELLYKPGHYDESFYPNEIVEIINPVNSLVEEFIKGKIKNIKT